MKPTLHRLFFLFFAVSVVGIVSFGSVFAQSTGTTQDTSQQAQDLQQQIDDLESKISDLQGQEKTLSNAIEVYDSQIALAESQIELTKDKIASLQEDIKKSQQNIDKLNSSLKDLTDVYLTRIVATYESGGEANPFFVILGSHNIQDYMTKENYLQIVQAHDRQLVLSTAQAKNDYANFKQIRQQEQQEAEDLQTQLQKQNDDLAAAKQQKLQLLSLTQGNEAVYQQKLALARAEQAAILMIGTGGGQEVKIKDVSEGDVVAHIIQGKSPCSSGTHLHFEVHSGGSVQDPSNYLSNTSFSYVDGDNGADEGAINPHGSWNWPLHGSILITQGFGMTPFAKVSNAYGPGGHTGIDMYSSDATVYAVKAGTLYRGSISCGGGALMYSKVDHGDGTAAYYLHTYP